MPNPLTPLCNSPILAGDSLDYYLVAVAATDVTIYKWNYEFSYRCIIFLRSLIDR